MWQNDVGLFGIGLCFQQFYEHSRSWLVSGLEFRVTPLFGLFCFHHRTDQTNRPQSFKPCLIGLIMAVLALTALRSAALNRC
jgi:hypothetical protein